MPSPQAPPSSLTTLCACGCGLPAKRKWASEACRQKIKDQGRTHRTGKGARQRYKARYRAEERAKRRTPSDQYPQPAGFIDGEAERRNGRSEYCLLQLLDGDDLHELYAREGHIPTEDCLELLFNSKKKMIFGYSLGYDISNWLTDLPVEYMRTLMTFNKVRWKHYLIEWIPSRYLRVVNWRRPKGDRQRKVYDLFPYCQTSYLKALEQWSIPCPEAIHWGKSERVAFSPAQIKQVRAYNQAELETMRELYTRLGKAFDAADIRPGGYWTGPGSCARTAVKKHEVNCSLTSGADDIVRSAYFGGRFECSMIGVLEQCYEYDLVSAYPHAITLGMPCMAHGEWRKLPKGTTEATHALWRVSWKPKQGHPMWAPFPDRVDDHTLAYPVQGKGWYHACEVLAAMEYLGQHYKFTVHEGKQWVPSCDCDPWSWVSDLANERARCKATDPGKAQAIKLALNSMYGVLADKAGTEPKPDPEGYEGFVEGSDVPRVPPMTNHYWAGLITARTRARLLEAIGLGWEEIVYIATDGIHSRSPLPLVTGKALGSWEEQPVDAACFAFGGCYAYKSRAVKSRGMRKGVTTYEGLLEQINAGKIVLSDDSFLGCRVAAHRSHGNQERYDQLKNEWTATSREYELTLLPRRIQREDGRWVALTRTAILALFRVMNPEDWADSDAETATDPFYEDD